MSLQDSAGVDMDLCGRDHVETADESPSRYMVRQARQFYWISDIRVWLIWFAVVMTFELAW